MINSRKLEDLLPYVQTLCQKFIDACAAEGIDILITSTYRDNESQEALYNQGRTTPGAIVTDAKAGYSFHNYKCAFDFVPLVNGKPAWNDLKLIAKCGAIGESIGLEWAGRWEHFKELLHCQYTGGVTIDQLRAGIEVK